MFGKQARNLFGRLTNIINLETKSNETEDNFTRMVQQDSKTFKVIQQKCKPEEKSIIEKGIRRFFDHSETGKQTPTEMTKAAAAL